MQLPSAGTDASSRAGPYTGWFNRSSRHNATRHFIAGRCNHKREARWGLVEYGRAWYRRNRLVCHQRQHRAAQLLGVCLKFLRRDLGRARAGSNSAAISISRSIVSLRGLRWGARQHRVDLCTSKTARSAAGSRPRAHVTVASARRPRARRSSGRGASRISDVGDHTDIGRCGATLHRAGSPRSGTLARLCPMRHAAGFPRRPICAGSSNGAQVSPVLTGAPPTEVPPQEHDGPRDGDRARCWTGASASRSRRRNLGRRRAVAPRGADGCGRPQSVARTKLTVLDEVANGSLFMITPSCMKCRGCIVPWRTVEPGWVECRAREAGVVPADGKLDWRATATATVRDGAK